jgi:hypothetical protein
VAHVHSDTSPRTVIKQQDRRLALQEPKPRKAVKDVRNDAGVIAIVNCRRMTRLTRSLYYAFYGAVGYPDF